MDFHSIIKNQKALLLSNFLIFLVFVAFSWKIRDFHPFSRFPMYSSFPNWSYYFYLEDERGEFVPFETYFGLNGGDVGHLFYSSCEHHNVWVGYGKESPEGRQIVGQDMMETLLAGNNRLDTLPFQQLSLYQVYLHLEADTITSDEFLLYTNHLE